MLSGEGDFRSLVAARKREQEEYVAAQPGDRIIFYGDIPLTVKSGVAEGGLRGIPGGNGCVVAKVCLMNSAEDRFTPGSIILTKRTDPGWISLFPLASGLIVEYGSMLSHSFVVAREMGLPAVVGVCRATELIPDGALVRLDGLSGEVTVLNEE